MTLDFFLFIHQFKREFLIQNRQRRLLINSGLFFLMILFIFPLTMKPEIELMRSVAPGLTWIAVLLSILLSSERIFQQDYEHGVIEQWLVSGRPVSLMVSAKVLAHWICNVLPLILLVPLVALFFSFSVKETEVLVFGLFCGTPALMFLCALAVSFGLSLSQKGALMALILLPLALPVLIFGAGMVNMAMQNLPIRGYCAFLLAMSVMAVGFLPFAIAGVIRISHSE